LLLEQIQNNLSVDDKMEEGISQSVQKAKALGQSILKKAIERRLRK